MNCLNLIQYFLVNYFFLFKVLINIHYCSFFNNLEHIFAVLKYFLKFKVIKFFFIFRSLKRSVGMSPARIVSRFPRRSVGMSRVRTARTFPSRCVKCLAKLNKNIASISLSILFYFQIDGIYNFLNFDCLQPLP